MKKSELKNGMVVETRAKEKYLMLNDYFMNENKNIYFTLTRLGENLMDLSFKHNFDIIKVYETTANNINNIFDEDKLKLIWERKEFKIGDHVKIISNNVELKHHYNIGIICEVTDVKSDYLVLKGVNKEKKHYLEQGVDFRSVELTNKPLTALDDVLEITIAELERHYGRKVKVVK